MTETLKNHTQIASINPPVLYNCMKHHLGFIRDYISANKEKYKYLDLKNDLLLIGTNRIDLYTGKLLPSVISEMVIEKLYEKKIFCQQDYEDYLTAFKGNYTNLKIDDGSSWILKKGIFAERFVHIHPAKKSKNTIATKSNSLKTAIWFHLINTKTPNEKLCLTKLNDIRVKYLGLSPLKSISLSTHMETIIGLLAPA